MNLRMSAFQKCMVEILPRIVPDGHIFRVWLMDYYCNRHVKIWSKKTLKLLRLAASMSLRTVTRLSTKFTRVNFDIWKQRSQNVKLLHVNATDRPAIIDQMFNDLHQMFLKQRQLDPQELATSFPTARLSRRSAVTWSPTVHVYTLNILSINQSINFYSGLSTMASTL